VFALVTTKTGTTGRKTGAAPSIRPFPMTSGFPLTVAVSVSRGHTPYIQSVSAIIPALRHFVKKGSGYEMAAVLLIST
jgi:hypothetical protein